MTYETWTNEKLADYCSFILGRPVIVKYVPISITKGTMVSFPMHNTLIRCSNSFPKSLVWHECGHLYYGFCFPFYKPINFKNFFSGHKPSMSLMESDILFEKCVKSEVMAHLWGYEEALNRGFLKLASEIKESMDVCEFDKYEVYSEAKRRILRGMKKLDKKYQKVN